MDIETIFNDTLKDIDKYSLETQTFIKQNYFPLLNRCNQVEHLLQQTANICQAERELRDFGKILVSELKQIQEHYTLTQRTYANR